MRFPVLVTILASHVAGAAAVISAQTSPLRLVSTAWPPFTNEQGQPRIALDLVEAAFKRFGQGSQTTIVEPARFTAALVGGDFDGSAAAWKDAERERALLFSQPYLENRLILVARAGSDVSATALGQLAGKRIAIVEGYSYGDAIETSGAILVRSRSEEDSLALVLASKTDYALMDDLVVQSIVDNYPKESQTRLSLGASPLLIRPLHLAVTRARPDAESIVERFNAQLTGMVADGTYHRLLQTPWIRVDIDGDGRAELVPRSDRAGRAEPQRAYTLFSDQSLSVSTGSPASRPGETKPGFYIGGNIYTDWATVPNRYKVEDPEFNPSQRTASIFRFTW